MTSSQPPAQPPGAQPQPLPAPTRPRRPQEPAYFGVVGKTGLACRYPAGVRVTRVIEGSPARRAGLKGEATLSWKDAMASILASSPVAPLIASGEAPAEHGYGDLILAVDGKRVHNVEEMNNELRRCRPGDVVYLSVLRGESGLSQIPVHLSEYPRTGETATTASAPAPRTAPQASSERQPTPGS